MIKTVQVASIMIKAKPTLRCGYIWLLGFVRFPCPKL